MLVATEHFRVEICRAARKAAINRRWLSSLIMRAISPTMDSPHRSVALFLASFLLTATRPRYALVLALVAAVCPHVCTPPEPSEVPRSSHAGAVEAFVHEWSRVHSRLVRVHLGPDRLLATSRSLGRCAAVKKLHQLCSTWRANGAHLLPRCAPPHVGAGECAVYRGDGVVLVGVRVATLTNKFASEENVGE